MSISDVQEIARANAKKAAALSLAERGGRVFPLRGKEPLTANGFHDGSDDADAVREWWDRWPDANVGLVIPEGYVVVDLDTDEGVAFAEEQGLPETVVARSGGGGFHYWFRLEGSGEYKKKIDARPGVDLLVGGKGYVVAPPSVHPSGGRYEWLVEPGEVAVPDAPEWVLELLTEERESKESSGEAVDGGADVIADGRRNDSLTSFAGRLRRSGCGYSEIGDALVVRNQRCEPPLPESECWTIARSVSNYPVGEFVRVDRRLLNSDVSVGAKVVGMLVSAGASDAEIADAMDVGERMVGEYWRELGGAGLEAICRDRPVRRYVRVPGAILFDAVLGHAERLAAAVIAGFMNDGVAQVGQERLAGAIGCARQRVSDYVCELERLGYLYISRGALSAGDDDGFRRARVNRYRWSMEVDSGSSGVSGGRREESMRESGHKRARGENPDMPRESVFRSSVGGGNNNTGAVGTCCSSVSGVSNGPNSSDSEGAKSETGDRPEFTKGGGEGVSPEPHDEVRERIDGLMRSAGCLDRCCAARSGELDTGIMGRPILEGGLESAGCDEDVLQVLECCVDMLTYDEVYRGLCEYYGVSYVEQF